MFNRKFLRIMTFIIVAGAFLTGCQEKSSDAVVDVYDYIGFMDSDEETTTTAKPQNDLAAVFVENTFSKKYRALIVDGKPYFDINGVKGYIDDRFYYDKSESKILFTTAGDEFTAVVGQSGCVASEDTSDVDYIPAVVKYDNCYISMEYVDRFDDISYSFYQGDDNTPPTLVIECESADYVRAKATEDNKMRTDADLMNAIITEVKSGSVVTILDEYDEWYKVQADTGFTGYVQKKYYEDKYTETITREDDKDTYVPTLIDEKIRIAWHQAGGFSDFNSYSDLTGSIENINVISPTWFSVSDGKGNISDISNYAYSEQAHQQGYYVWALADDFATNSDGEHYINKAITKSQTRIKLENNLVSAVENSGADGLNIDFEYISSSNGDSYRQFLRELSKLCRAKKIILSVDNYVPTDWSSFYGMDMQAQVADYVIVMSYDEYTAGSEEAGPVASITYVENAVKDCIDLLGGDSSRLVMGIPFYTRVWKTTPEEYADAEAKIIEDSVDGNYAINSEALTMQTAKDSYTAMGAEPVWNSVTGTNYVSYEVGNTTYTMWLEDKDSIAEKLKIAEKYEVGGIACWKLGLETDDVWPVIATFK